jgi:hypothetical protein
MFEGGMVGDMGFNIFASLIMHYVRLLKYKELGLLKMLTHSARRCVIILWFTSLEYC